MPRPLRNISLLCLLVLGACASAESRLADGDALYQRGMYADALRQYQLARRDDPTLPGIDEKIRTSQIRMYVDQGDRYAQRQQWDQARRSYEEVRRLDPGNSEAEERLAQLQRSRADHHFARGTLLMSQGNPLAAVAEFEQALALSPDHPRAAVTMERAMRQREEQQSRAEDSYRQGLRARDEGRFDEALRHFAAALQFDPDHAAAGMERKMVEAAIVDELVARGDDALQAGRFAEAVSAYREARQRDPRRLGLEARIDRAQLEARAEDLAAEGDRALGREDWHVAYDRFDAACRATAEPERFGDRLEQARDALVATLQTAAREHEAAGRYDEALSALGRICELQPGRGDAHQRHAALRDSLARAEESYHDGYEAEGACDLQTAQDCYRRCTAAIPGYRDVEVRLLEIGTSLRMAERFYDRADEAERSRDIQRARLLYQECLAVVRPFRDATDRLRRLQRQPTIQVELSQYDDACQFQASRDLCKARELLMVCRAQRPGYRDVDQRLTDVEAAIARAQRDYADGRRAEEECRLTEARQHYRQCLATCTPYEDVGARLQRIDMALASMREARRLDRQRRLVDARQHYREVLKAYPRMDDARRRANEIDEVCADLESRHGQMRAAARAGKFRQALMVAVEIQNRCVGYEDVDASIARFECEADYADGRAFEAGGQHEAALRCYERCVERDPKFRDVDGRAEECRRRIGVPSRPGK